VTADILALGAGVTIAAIVAVFIALA